VIGVLSSTYSIRMLCDLLNCARSSYYRQPPSVDDVALENEIRTVAGQWPTYGYRRITEQLRRQKHRINHKRVYRLMRKLGITKKVKRKKRKTTNSQHDFPRYPNLVQDLIVVRPNQAWVSDITYIHLRSEFVYLAVIMDVFTRNIRGWHLGRGLDQSLTITALSSALAQHTPKIHHSDQGVQYAATAYVELLSAAGAQISMADVGQAWQNGYAERLMRTIKEEEVDLSDYQDYTDAHQQLGRFLDDVYRHKRIHSSLGYLTPAEFEQRWQQTQSQLETVN
jgi:transposase InsO family protein